MGRRGRLKKVNVAKNKGGSMGKAIEGTPVEKVVATLKNMGFGPGDIDLGIEVIEAIEAIVGSPIQSLRKDSSRESTPALGSGKETVSVPDVGAEAEPSEARVVAEEGDVGNQKVDERVVNTGDSQQVEGEGSNQNLGGEKDLGLVRKEDEDRGRRAWAEVAKGPPSLHRDQKLQYYPPSEKGVVITEEDCKEGLEHWKYAVVGYAIGQKPGFRVMQRYVSSMWKKAAPQVHQLNPGVFMFRFFNEEDMESVLNSRWTFNRAPLIMQRWKPGMKVENLKPEKVAVWIRLSGLELHQWSNVVLGKLASFVGKPLHSDLLTAVRDRINFARILVEVNINDKLPDSIPLITEIGTSYVPVIYEWYPAECTNCSKWGHQASLCPGGQKGKQVVQQESGHSGEEKRDSQRKEQGKEVGKMSEASTGPVSPTKVWRAKTIRQGEGENTAQVEEVSDVLSKQGASKEGGVCQSSTQTQNAGEGGGIAEVALKEREGDKRRATHPEVPDPPPLL